MTRRFNYFRGQTLKLWVAAVLLLALLDSVLYMAAAEEQADFLQKKKENETIQRWADAHEDIQPRRAFLTRLMTPDASGFSGLEEELQETGFHIEELAEEEAAPSEQGEIERLRLTGYGHFTQILSIFDIINNKDFWMVLHVRRMERREGFLFMDAEIRTFRYRGTHEKEEYRAHRPYGDREKPGGPPAG